MSISSSISGGGGGGAGSGGTGTIVGSTGSTDNRLIRSDGTGGVTIQNSTITVADSGAVSGNLVGTLNSAGGITLTSSDSGKQVNIVIGGGDDAVTLPASPTIGTWFDFCVIGTDELTVQAQGSHVIRIGNLVSSAGGTAICSVRGSRLNLLYAAPNQWLGISSGTWTVA